MASIHLIIHGKHFTHGNILQNIIYYIKSECNCAFKTLGSYTSIAMKLAAASTITFRAAIAVHAHVHAHITCVQMYTHVQCMYVCTMKLMHVPKDALLQL